MIINNFYVDSINNIKEKDIVGSTIVYYDIIFGKIKEIKLTEELISGNKWSVFVDVITTDRKLIKQFKEDKERNGYYYKF